MHTARKRTGKRKRRSSKINWQNSKNIFAVVSALISVNRPQSRAGMPAPVDDGWLNPPDVIYSHCRLICCRMYQLCIIYVWNNNRMRDGTLRNYGITESRLQTNRQGNICISSNSMAEYRVAWCSGIFTARKRSLEQGNVFTRVPFCSQRGFCIQGVCIQGGLDLRSLHPGGVCIQGVRGRDWVDWVDPRALHDAVHILLQCILVIY